MNSFGKGYTVMVVVVLTLMTTSDATKVHIQNRLGDGWSCNVHCASGDNDLGVDTVADGGDFSWSFNIAFDDSTLFHCNIWWGSYDFQFAAFDAAIDYKRCAQDCWWLVDQFALYTWDQNQWDVFHFWATG